MRLSRRQDIRLPHPTLYFPVDLSGRRRPGQCLWLPYGTPALDLLNVLDSSPHLALYVRNLTIFSSNPGGSVEIILPLLHNVECLRILGYDILWWELPRSLHTAVEDAISQPALQELYISGTLHITVPLNFMLHAMSSCRLLSLTGTTVDPDKNIPENRNATTARLQHLILNERSDIRLLMGTLGRLTRLEVQIPSEVLEVLSLRLLPSRRLVLLPVSLPPEPTTPSTALDDALAGIAPLRNVLFLYFKSSSSSYSKFILYTQTLCPRLHERGILAFTHITANHVPRATGVGISDENAGYLVSNSHDSKVLNA
ncbi:hypothetical protein C8J57DRAFT_1642958 [Mycena rebaudengoi]|nr:hypothetical protein C8J57DRAFT_1642958 [Mycena rebaudengoi]